MCVRAWWDVILLSPHSNLLTSLKHTWTHHSTRTLQYSLQYLSAVPNSAELQQRARHRHRSSLGWTPYQFSWTFFSHIRWDSKRGDAVNCSTNPLSWFCWEQTEHFTLRQRPNSSLHRRRAAVPQESDRGPAGCFLWHLQVQHHEFVPRARTDNAEYCCVVLVRLSESVRGKWPELSPIWQHAHSQQVREAHVCNSAVTAACLLDLPLFP